MPLPAHGDLEDDARSVVDSVADWDSLRSARTQLAYDGGFIDPAITQIATMLRDMLGRETMAHDRMFAEGLRIALAARLIGQYVVDGKPRPSRPTSLDLRRLRRVLEFIEARLGEDLSLNELAQQACLSRFHFTRIFAVATGASPHRYITQRRVETAQAMLVRDNAPLAQIALDVGFGSQANFTRVFRKATGMTPRRFRQIYSR